MRQIQVDIEIEENDDGGGDDDEDSLKHYEAQAYDQISLNASIYADELYDKANERYRKTFQ